MTCQECGKYIANNNKLYCCDYCQKSAKNRKRRKKDHIMPNHEFPVGRQVWFRWLGVFLVTGVVTELRYGLRLIELKEGTREWVSTKDLSERRPCTIGGAL